ncbi:DoxX family protein [Actinomadura fibrosa]|uniref:DoxX family protein n=1 Tax=Actinomadura fibrosa TaxID=111802 RepID=A0ABW2XP12_9ACTN|nr:DoxX family protein [Actinomadura fibrosa]
MHTIYVTVIVATILANAGMAAADFAKARFVLANSAEVGVPPSAVPVLGVLKAAGAVGLLAGLLGFVPLGIAAAVGLVAFFLGALAVHVRARVFYNIAFPGTYLALAAASLALLFTR